MKTSNAAGLTAHTDRKCLRRGAIRACAIVVAIFVAASGVCAAEPQPGASAAAQGDVTIRVADRVAHQMKSGVGASWHAMLFPTVSHGGSGFGGSPPVIPRHQRLWQSMEKHADWLALKFVRAEMEWRFFEPRRGQYAWDAPEMQVLERILAWAQRHQSDVMLQCMWVNLPWQAFPEYRGDPALEQASAPADLDAWAAGWVALLDHLVRKRGYTCIRWINLVNEPNFYWWFLPPDSAQRQDRPRQVKHMAEAMRKIRAAMRKANLDVKIMGPDMVDLPHFERLAAEPWFTEVDDVDFHSYGACFDFEDPAKQAVSWAYKMGPRFAETLVRYRAETTAAGKGLFLSEAGSMCYGYKGENPAPGTFKASLKDTELLVRTMNLGIDGFNHWSFVNRGDQDGQWQYIDTWNPLWKLWRDEAAPHRDAYYVLGLATRHLPHRAEVLATTVDGGFVASQGGLRRVWAATARSPRDGSLTLLIVNDASSAWNARLQIDKLPIDAGRPVGGPDSSAIGAPKAQEAPGKAQPTLWVLRSTAGADPAAVLRYERIAAPQGKASLRLAPLSLTILTDRPLDPAGPGRW